MCKWKISNSWITFKNLVFTLLFIYPGCFAFLLNHIQGFINIIVAADMLNNQ